jgi:hypothetical protein
MGFLSDIRSGKRGHDFGGACAVIFWIAAGLALGGGVAMVPAKPLPGSAVGVLVVVGVVLGSAIGFYAAWGVSVVARVLAIPGLIVGFLIELAR